MANAVLAAMQGKDALAGAAGALAGELAGELAQLITEIGRKNGNL